MIHEIGENAGKVWHYVEQHPGAMIEQIAKELRLKENPVCLAIGWLAREGKLEFKNDGKKTKVLLAGQYGFDLGRAGVLSGHTQAEKIK